MDEVRSRVARMFEAHLSVDEKSEFNPNFVTVDREGIGLLIDTINGYLLGRLKNWYIDDGTEHPWIIKVISLLRAFVVQFTASSTSYQTVYDEFLKVRDQCWEIINQ